MRVLVRAYMAMNLGDDLFLDTLFRRFPNVSFEIESWFYDEYKKFTDNYSNASIRKNESFVTRLKKKLGLHENIDARYLEGFDAIINIGGSIFKENPDCDLLDVICEKEVMFAKKKGIPYYFVSCNFESIYSQQFLERKRRMFKNCTRIFFRDKYSYELFKDMENVDYSEDFVFLSPYRDELTKINSQRILGISVIDMESRDSLRVYENEYHEFLINAIKRFFDKNYKLRFFAFSVREGDLKAIEKIVDQLDENIKSNVEIIEYAGDIPKFMKAFAECEKIICTRFHSMVLSILSQKEFYPIIYNDKLLNIIKDMDLCRNYFMFDKENNLEFSKFIPEKVLCDRIFRYFNKAFDVDK